MCVCALFFPVLFLSVFLSLVCMHVSVFACTFFFMSMSACTFFMCVRVRMCVHEDVCAC